ncbi:tryptophan halogenase [Steroidobacter agaridevorans]|uniref:Tryptophan halogenase n=1 Tax=Steroidobacter agaridevorans TaxID=2695856 RepID=A0A829Y8M3_9GAMM|nr:MULTISPECIES: tryptophan halogenase family protein [Steroidobacteraceae]GFE79218.1 tryptophan halogenase [Steroidobacter agaridevorans]GFE87259.1 tryptophan halogenase [Steroidobacter agaridevorans]
MAQQTRSVAIIGGGTAGWLTAGILASAVRESGVTVTLVESPTVASIGVGEGTWPTMRRSLKRMGIRETDFIRRCNASLKQGARFSRWAKDVPEDFYYHPLVLPEGRSEVNLGPHWASGARGQSFAASVCAQERVCEAGLSPKQITTAEYDGVLNYAYHLDAGLFADFLREHCVERLGVKHVLADVVGVNSTPSGDICSVATLSSDEIGADFFVDCTGFRSLLLGRHFGVPFKSCKDILFIDTALAVQVPYEDEQAPIASHTISTAQEAGWIWDIGLWSRRGVGHVYSSAHTSEERARRRLYDYLRPAVPRCEELSVRKIGIEPGHRTRFWERNCVAVGLSAGFLEPLEASAILLIEIAAAAIADKFPNTRESMDVLSRRFNAAFLYRWDRIIDFLKLHYVLSQRSDNSFWLDNRAAESVPGSLKELLTLWRYHDPWVDDLEHAIEVFPAASYQYVLYGMGFDAQCERRARPPRHSPTTDELFQRNEALTRQLLARMPANRALLDKIRRYGLQSV